MKLSVFGTGYVGLVTGASLANLGHDVLCVDVDEEKIRMLKEGVVPFFEPGLLELVQINFQRRRLSFTSDVKEGVAFAEVIFNCVGTPQQKDGSADLSFVFSVATMVAQFSQDHKILVNKSTVPPGTAQKCAILINEYLKKRFSGKISYDDENIFVVDVVSNPEFLKQGSAVYDFNNPDKIVIGGSALDAIDVVKKIYLGLVPDSLFVETNLETAEMIKYANNAFLATKISYVNEIANICDLIGADIKIVTKAMGMDIRIGQHFLNAGIGYGGSCFPKDVLALHSAAGKNGYNAVILREVDAFNERQKGIFFPKIMEALRRVNGDTVTLWGLSFKPKTSDIRGATSLVLLDLLLKEKIKVKVYDPEAMGEIRKVYGERVLYAHSLQESVASSNVIVLVTEWDEFRNVDFASLGSQMRSKIIFDGRNIYDSKDLHREGFVYFGVGRR